MGYLIPFAPYAFAPQRQPCARRLPSPFEFLRISLNFTSPPDILSSCNMLKNLGYASTNSGKAWRFVRPPQDPPTCPLRPIILNSTRPLRLTAAAGTEFCRGFFSKNGQYLLLSKEVYRPTWVLLPSCDITGSGFRPLSKIPDCSFLRIWAVSQSQCGCTSSQTSQGSWAW